MRRFKLGFKLAGQSWRVLRGHPALLAFPLVGALVAIVIVGPPAAVGAWLVDRGDTFPGAAVLVVALYLASFITAFMAVGLVAAADAVMRGQEASLGFGMRVARSHLAAISGWALINAVLSLVLGALESRGGGGQLAAGLVGGAWTVVSLLAIPAIALEDAGPFKAIRRSASIFREQWGGQVVGMAAIGIAVFLFGILPAMVIIVVGVAILSSGGGSELAAGEIVLAAGIVLFAIAALVSAALRQVFAAALYRYATTGAAPAAFAESDLRSAVRLRGGGTVAPA
jgi:Family of unknown function (DUF6159)